MFEPPMEPGDVLVATPPELSFADAEELGRRLFGFVGTATDLGSERDQNFRLTDDRGHSVVLKVSNPADTREIVELQTLATVHVGRADSDLPVARPLRTIDGSLWGPVERREGSYFVRLFTFLDGSGVDASDLTGDQLRDFGRVIARVGRALRGFFHPAAGRKLQWDSKHAAELRTMTADIEGDRRRKLVTRVVDWFETEAAPVLGQLRAQIVHGDLVLDNVLVADGLVTGILDFGDVTHTALVCDVAASLADVMRVASDPFELASPVIEGYRSITELDNDEKALLPVLVATRFATMVTISAARARRYPENADNITAWDPGSWRFLETLEDLGPVEAERRFRAILDIDGRTALRARRHDSESLERRRRVLGGSTLSPLSYKEPLNLVRGQGAWMFDDDGRAYLDAYNNVPVVGHCDPAVTEAIASQARTLNTNTRYLHEHVVELAERLTASMPEELDTCILVNSGSEANDIAWRLATSFTGNGGGIVSQHAYHGITEATDALSPEEWAGAPPGHVATIPAPDGYRGPHLRLEPYWATRFAQHVTDAVSVLVERGMRPAATMMDSMFTSDGILPTPPEYLREVIGRTREAGGLFVADEVQTGFGRTGDLWGFEASSVAPDIVTLGKPMGNGHPVAAVVTRSDIAQVFAKSGEFFSTFGGNPVSCAAGLAVLEVLEREALPARAARVGAYLREGLKSLAGSHPWIGDVRGRGLLIGVELVRPNTREPAPSQTDAVVNAMRERGVLIGVTGPAGNVLKIRPPLVFTQGNADMLITALSAALSASHA